MCLTQCYFLYIYKTSIDICVLILSLYYLLLYIPFEALALGHKSDALHTQTDMCFLSRIMIISYISQLLSDGGLSGEGCLMITRNSFHRLNRKPVNTHIIYIICSPVVCMGACVVGYIYLNDWITDYCVMTHVRLCIILNLVIRSVDIRLARVIRTFEALIRPKAITVQPCTVY